MGFHNPLCSAPERQLFTTPGACSLLPVIRGERRAALIWLWWPVWAAGRLDGQDGRIAEHGRNLMTCDCLRLAVVQARVSRLNVIAINKYRRCLFSVACELLSRLRRRGNPGTRSACRYRRWNSHILVLQVTDGARWANHHCCHR